MADEARQIAVSAQMDQWGAHLREVMWKSLGLPAERAPWDETNENEEDT
jgi:hypothetical protein